MDGMDRWMFNNGNSEIMTKCCPHCKTPIRVCLRYGNVIKTTFHDIAQVKNSYLQMKETPILFFNEIKEKLLRCESLVAKFRNINRQISTDLASSIHRHVELIRRKIAKKKKVFPTLRSDEQFTIRIYLKVIETVGEYVKFARELVRNASELSRLPHYNLLRYSSSRSSNSTIGVLMTEALFDQFCDICHKFLCFVMATNSISTREYRAIERELARLDYLRVYFVLKSDVRGPELAETKIIEQLLINNIKILEEDQKVDLTNALETMGKKMETKLRNISVNEDQQEIATVIGMCIRHWRKCVKGHIYAIEECEEVVAEENYCSECYIDIDDFQQDEFQ